MYSVGAVVSVYGVRDFVIDVIPAHQDKHETLYLLQSHAGLFTQNDLS